MLEHEELMRRCIELALQARARGDTPVGSLVVREGVILAEGLEAVSLGDVTAHAEINAIREACLRLGRRDLTGSVLYSTAEPCVMCSYAIRQARIGKVVLGSLGSKLGGVTSAYSLLTDASVPGWPEPPEVLGPVLGEACEELRGQGSEPKPGRGS